METQEYKCMKIFLTGAHDIPILYSFPEVPQIAFTYGGNRKGKTNSFLKHPMNCAYTYRKTQILSLAIFHTAHPSPT